MKFALRDGTLRTRLVVSSIATLTVALLFLGVIVRLTVRTVLMASIERRLRDEVGSSPPPFRGDRQGLGGMGSIGGGGPPDLPHSDDTSQHRAGSVYTVRHFDLSGNPIGVRPLLDRNAFLLAKAGAGRDVYSTLTINEESVLVLTTPYRQGGHVAAVVQAGFPLTEVNQVLKSLDWSLFILIPIALLVAGASGAYLTSRVLQTVHETTRAARRIGVQGESSLSERLPVVGNDEFAELAATFNGLLGRVEQTVNEQKRLVEQQRRFTADASHELKTPLTVIRGMTNLALQGDGTTAAIEPRLALERIDAASAGMAHLVQDLLLLARTDSGQSASRHIELLVDEMLNQAASRTLALAAGVTPRIEVADASLAVRGSENELVRVFTNLLDNAARYHASPDTAAIVMRARREGDEAVVQVSDNGVGIAPEHLRHLGERFYRADASRARSEGGTGLGLSICRGIVAAHGGTIGFESVVGVGTVVTVRLPVARVEE